MKIIILGPTGSGKGTQARFISKLLRLKYIEIGALLRERSKKNKFIKNRMKEGKLIPDKYVSKIINKEIKKKGDFILDGFPRTLKQLKMLKFKPDLVFCLKVSKNNIIKRLLIRKRFDDNKENIEERYYLYLKKTLPVINYYKKKNILVAINGNSPIKQVSEKIKKILTKYQQQQ